MADYRIKPLAGETWDAFAALYERHNGGGFGDCWCCWFHNATLAERRAEGGGDWRAYKKRRVCEGTAHAALVFDGETAVLYNATRSMFEKAGFRYEHAKGKNHCVMRTVVEPSRTVSRRGTRGGSTRSSVR